MKILVLSESGKILPLAYALQEEGNQVKLWTPKSSIAGRNIIERVAEWRPNVSWSDFVIVESPHLVNEDTLRKMGRPFLGTSELGQNLMESYVHHTAMFNACGVKYPWTADFGSADEVEELVNNWRQPGFRLMLGDYAFDMTTEEQMRWLLNSVDIEWPQIFQRIVPGVRLVHEGWFNGRDWVNPFIRQYLEHPGVSEGNLVGDAAHAGTAHGVGADDLTAHTLSPLGGYLREASYRGPVSVSFVVSSTGVWCTSVRCGFTSISIPLLLEGMMEPIGDALFEVASGTKEFFEYSPDLVGATAVSCIDGQVGSFEGFPIDNLSDMTARHFKFSDIFESSDNSLLYRMAGESGLLGYAAAFGNRPDILRKRIVTTVKSLRLPYVTYRKDVGYSYERARKNMTGWGFSYV